MQTFSLDEALTNYGHLTLPELKAIKGKGFQKHQVLAVINARRNNLSPALPGDADPAHSVEREVINKQRERLIKMGEVCTAQQEHIRHLSGLLNNRPNRPQARENFELEVENDRLTAQVKGLEELVRRLVARAR